MESCKSPQVIFTALMFVAIVLFVLFAGYDVDNAVTALIGVVTGLGLGSASRD